MTLLLLVGCGGADAGLGAAMETAGGSGGAASASSGGEASNPGQAGGGSAGTMALSAHAGSGSAAGAGALGGSGGGAGSPGQGGSAGAASGGASSAGSAGAGGAVCVPRVCTSCGTLIDGCGAVVDCGSCTCSADNPCKVASQFCSADHMCADIGAGCTDSASATNAVCVRYPEGSTTANKFCAVAPPASLSCMWSTPTSGSTYPPCWLCNGAPAAWL